ncbi:MULTISPECIES: hypothetical protein [Actinotignum]|uniref:Uncharacterized protein n=2 Tax=Actinotignum TaxID=1653174 RepID=A0AAW9HP44_9ACTO|nr:MULTISPECIES: hypothetical protein [Actinotignum]MDE1559224.1 hypothetical protein [Actinotignum schaalii]MDE1663933.1 hypothetical protein [Actinotignum schaalii]MDK6374138.1 hypothetical protein [Actinotignum timonense]MDK6419398.1 hypothetical protein [Actinotignum timonense]MDK6590679.1 hypothetical protein [Actinotignum timonense]
MDSTQMSIEEMANWFENCTLADFDTVEANTAAIALEKARIATQQAQLASLEAVCKARENGLTWEQIGGHLHLSRQGTFQKYAHKIAS